jgi:DNA-directed RNA polymerase subunit H (RpoH/RPB5)
VFHLIQGSFPEIFNEEEWSNLNKNSFKYADCSTCTDKLGLDIYKNTDGFLTEYSKTIPSEDMAEVYSFLVTDKENLEKIKKIDPIIFNKVEFIESKIKKIINL